MNATLIFWGGVPMKWVLWDPAWFPLLSFSINHIPSYLICLSIKKISPSSNNSFESNWTQHFPSSLEICLSWPWGSLFPFTWEYEVSQDFSTSPKEISFFFQLSKSVFLILFAVLCKRFKRTWSQISCVWIPFPLFLSYMTVGKLRTFLQFPCL